MNKLLLFAFLLVSSSLFSQDKKTYYFDENLAPISKETYLKDEKNPGKLLLHFEVDTALINIDATREQRGNIPVSLLRLIKKDLEKASGTVIDSTHLLVIDYYPGKDDCNASGTTDKNWISDNHKKYVQKLHALAPVSQFYVYSEPEGLERYEGIQTWYPDTNNRIKNTFFRLHYPCGSVVVIHPNGTFWAYYGEYSKDQVWKYVKQINKKQ